MSLANEERIELEKAGGCRLTIRDRQMPATCLTGPTGCEALAGQIVLEELDRIPHPIAEKLTPRPESPFPPTLKRKKSESVEGEE